MHSIIGTSSFLNSRISFLCTQIKNYYIGAGMNSTGIATAGGFGKALAEWIYSGEVTIFSCNNIYNIRVYIDA